MPNPYPVTLRDRAVRAYAAGGTYPAVAQQFAVGDRTLLRWVQQERETGSLSPRRKGRGPAVAGRARAAGRGAGGET